MATSRIRGGCTMREPESNTKNETRPGLENCHKGNRIPAPEPGGDMKSIPPETKPADCCCVVSMFPCNLFSRPRRQAQLPKSRSTYVCDRPQQQVNNNIEKLDKAVWGSRHQAP